MTFDDRILAFAERFLSARTCELVVVPAVADLQFEDGAAPVQRAVQRLAVLRAVAGGVRDDFTRALGGMVALSLLPAGYYIFLLILCFDVYSLSIARDFAVVALAIAVLSFGPVVACFWPERPQPRRLD